MPTAQPGFWRRDEVLAEILAKQREYADGTPGQRAQRTRQDSIGHDPQRAVGREFVDDHGLTPHLRHRQKLAMGPGHELHVSRALAVARPDQCDAFVGYDERGGSAAQVLDRLLENAFQVVGSVIRRRMVGRAIPRFEQSKR